MQKRLGKEIRAGVSKRRPRISLEPGHRCFLTCLTYQNLKIRKLYILFKFQVFLKNCKNPTIPVYNPTGQEGEAPVLSFAIVPTIPKVSPGETERSVAFYPLALRLCFLFYLLEARRHLALQPLYERNSPRVETERMHSGSKRRLVYNQNIMGNQGTTSRAAWVTRLSNMVLVE